MESPVAGIVREARNAVEVTIEVAGAALAGAIAAGEPSRGYLDVPRLTDGDLWASALDVGRAGAVVVAGSSLSAQAISRARAMSIRGLIAGSVGEGELRDLEASEQRQKASLAPSVLFRAHRPGRPRAPAASRRRFWPCWPPWPVARWRSSPTRRCWCSTPPRCRCRSFRPTGSAPAAGRTPAAKAAGSSSAGLYRFRGGIHLEAAVVRFADETETTIVPVTDLERFVF